MRATGDSLTTEDAENRRTGGQARALDIHRHRPSTEQFELLEGVSCKLLWRKKGARSG